jgi:Ca-activated chloride channel family protein
MFVRMSAPFGVEARCERASVSSGKSTLWASLRVSARGKGLESDRAPLAVALVIDVSPSMQGEPLAHALRSAEIVADLLDARDHLAIVTFSHDARVLCGLTRCDDDGRALLRAALRTCTVESATNIHAGIAVAAGVLATAPAGLRRAMVVLSDGQPNRGLVTAADLATFTASLRPIGVSSLGFGAHHDEQVLAAIAAAGSGRYAYIPDPVLARVELARAALAHGGIVAEQLELELRPAAGVELVQLLPKSQLRVGGAGVKTAIGDVFVDEARILAFELAIDLGPSGTLGELVVRGRSPDGTMHEQAVKLAVDVHAGPHVVDRAAVRDILLVRADAARADARAHADRHALPAAAAVLRALIQEIEASDGFVRNDGSELAECREQLEDEAANYERRGNDVELAHQRKGAMAYTAGTATAGARHKRHAKPAPGVLIGLSHAVQNRRFQLYEDTSFGRSPDNEVQIHDGSISRRHARIVYTDGHFALTDMGSTNGCQVNGQRVMTRKHVLNPGDIIAIGHVELRFEPGST